MSAQTMDPAVTARGAAPAGAQLRLYNTWTHRTGVFAPIEAGKVGFYACGPTVYDYVHIGNLRTYLFADLLRRVLEAEGYAVRHVMNITDVGHLTSDSDDGEDKMERGARNQGRSAWEIAAYYAAAFQRDLQRLQVKEPHVLCRATDHIPQMIDLIKEIERNGFIYRTSDGLYFDTSRMPEYGRLGRLNLAGQHAGARVGRNDEKRQPQDFALWKFAPPDERRQMEWDSPWGRGFPGWHIECSAMSAHHLGVPFDVHSSAIDHIPVHHTNEIAQTWAATGKLLANWWLHGEFLVLKDRRMGKSEGNFITLQTLIDRGVKPLAYRYLTYQAHYRAPLTFTDEALDAASSALQRLHGIMSTFPTGEAAAPDPESLARFRDALRDDLNAPQAVAAVWKVAQDNSMLPAVQRATLLSMNEVLPLGLADVLPPRIEVDTPPAEAQALMERREAARKARDFATADTLRHELAQLGYEVRDTAQGPELRQR